MKARNVFLFFLIFAGFIGLLAVAPFPQNPFSLKKLWKQTGLEKQEESRRQLIEQRKKMAAKILRQKLQEMQFRRVKEDQRVPAERTHLFFLL